MANEPLCESTRLKHTIYTIIIIDNLGRGIKYIIMMVRRYPTRGTAAQSNYVVKTFSISMTILLLFYHIYLLT